VSKQVKEGDDRANALVEGFESHTMDEVAILF
jgi:hypothetical protein